MPSAVTIGEHREEALARIQGLLNRCRVAAVSTALKKWPATGEAKRVYVERPKLKAKLWFERRGDAFEVRHYGNDADFGVVAVPGEPVPVQEARAALGDLGLDLNRCRWAEIVAKAT